MKRRTLGVTIVCIAVLLGAGLMGLSASFRNYGDVFSVMRPAAPQ